MDYFASVTFKLPGSIHLELKTKRETRPSSKVEYWEEHPETGKAYMSGYQAYNGIYKKKCSAVYAVESQAAQIINVSEAMWNHWISTPPSNTALDSFKGNSRKDRIKTFSRSTELVRANAHISDIIADRIGIQNPTLGVDFTINFY